ncbi:MAG: ShlB/FhaC/HecB family hemolysin secretion/activation protein [Verrucomicrobiota bacterium]
MTNSNTFEYLRVKSVGAAAAVLLSVLLVAASAVSAAEATPATGQPLQAGTEKLLHIVVVAKTTDVDIAGVKGVKERVLVKGPKFLQRKDFEKEIDKFIGKTLTAGKLLEMQTNIVKFCRKRGHLVVDVVYREQDVLDGTIQIVVLEGIVGKVTVTDQTRKLFASGIITNDPSPWFKNSIVSNGVRLKPGEVVIEQKVDSGLNWVNRNTYQSLGYFNGSFREVTTSFQQGELGMSDVVLKADERFPLRGFVGIDDAGIAVIGNNQFFAGFNWANAFGLDHRLNYQYISDLEFDKFSENVASYVVPLPWRHELTLFGAYADLNPDFSAISPSLSKFSNKGFFYQLSLRYAIPLPAPLNYDHEITAGFDYKRTDTPLLSDPSNPSSIVSTNNINVAQFMLGYSGRLPDKYGSTAIGLQGFYSPGGIGQYNNEAAFDGMTRNSNPQYLYGRATIIRNTPLPYGFTWYLNAAGQLSDARLVATEAFSLGGWNTVRGYDQNVVSGDGGWLVVNELRTQRFPLFGNFHGKTYGKDGQRSWWNDGIQGLVFCDYGGAYWGGGAQPPEGWPSSEILLSVGVGLRYQMRENFMFRFDYGWQLDRSYVNAPGAATLGSQPNSRAHFGLELSF